MSTALPAAVVDEPLARVLAFSRRFGRETTALAMHAALPLGLSPELVHLLRVNFVPRAPWIAEADLLLSPLCMEAGGGMYEMDPDVRELLLAEMARTPALGPARQRQVAQFLRLWAARALNDAADPDQQEHLRVQQWVALAYAEPARAAEELAGALRAGVERGSRPEVARVARLTAILSAPLAAEVELRRYAGTVQRVSAGAAASVSSGAGAITVGGEVLPALDDVVRLWRPVAPGGGTASTAADEPLQSQANVADEPIQQGTTEDAADPATGYRVARVLVLGDERVGKSSLVARIIDEVRDHGHATHGAVSTRWEAWSSETGAQDVVFHEPDLGGGPLAMRMAESDAVLVVVNAGSAEMEGAARRWLSAAAATAVTRPTLLVVNKSDTAEFIPSALAAVVREFKIGGPYLTSALGGQGIEALRTQLREIIPWPVLPAARSREEVDALEARLEERLGSHTLSEFGERTRRELGTLLDSADPGGALARAMDCLAARGFVRVIGDPPLILTTGENYARCQGEVWRFVGEARHDVPGLPSAPMHLVQRHFATVGLGEYLDGDPLPGLLDFVVEDLVRRRWAYEVDVRRGQLVVIPSLYRPHETLPGTTEPGGHPLVWARWPGSVDDVFVLLLVHLADYGTIDLRPPRSALFAAGTELFQLHASTDEETAQVVLSSLRSDRAGDELVELVRDRVVEYLPEGVHAEFIYAKSTTPSRLPLDPPEGVDLERACVVVLPFGTKQVGDRSIDFDAVWEHLFSPAVEAVRLTHGDPLVPVRVSELPGPGMPLPDWMQSAPIALVDLTGADAERIRALVLMPGFRTQRVLFVQETYDPPRGIADEQVVGYAYGDPEVLAGQRELLVQRLYETLGVPGGGTGTGGEMLVVTADPLNVREGPGTEHHVLVVLGKGVPLERLEQAGDWLRVRTADGAVGWIIARFAAPVKTTVSVIRGSLDLRAGPDPQQTVIEQLARGMTLDRLELSSNAKWARVRTPAGVEGWVLAQHVEHEAGEAAPDAGGPAESQAMTEPVSMAIFARRTAAPGDTVRVKVLVFEERAHPEVEKRLRQMSAPREEVSWSTALGNPHPGATLEIRIGAAWSRERQYRRISWSGQTQEVDALLRVPPEIDATETQLLIDVYADEMRLGTTGFAINIHTPAEEAKTRPAPTTVETRTAFASYARADRERVLDLVPGIRSATGLEVFADVLPAGEDLSETIQREICSRDVFLLFWSEAAAASDWVEHEWRRALECFQASGKPEIQIHLLEEGAANLLPEELRHLHADVTPRTTPVVFIGGTGRDDEERAAVMDACARADVRGTVMEAWPAKAVDVIQASRDAVDGADMYIGILGHRYGFVPQGSDVSIMEIQHQRARERGMPMVVFMPSEEIRQRPDDMDTGEAAEKLQRFKARILRESPVQFFDDMEDLRIRAVRTLIMLRLKLDVPPTDESELPPNAQQAPRPRRKGEEPA